MGRAPLASHVLCRDSGFEDFRERLNELFYPADVTALPGTAGRGDELRGGELRGIRTEHVTVGLMTFAQRTRVDPGRTPSHYHVNVVLRGAVEAAAGRQEMVAGAGDAMVFSPARQHRLLSCASGARHLGVKIDRRLVESELQDLLGRPLQAPLDFAFGFDLTSPAGRSWRSALDLLLAEADNPGGLLLGTSPLRRHYERLLVGGLLLAQPHTYTTRCAARSPPPTPGRSAEPST